MSETISKQYFLWLNDLVRQSAPSGRSYGKLTLLLFIKEFTWTVPYDQNRLADGKFLRESYASANNIDVFELDTPCSVLEVMIAMARRMEDSLYEPSKGDRTLVWLWTLIKHLGLETFTDQAYKDFPDSFEDSVDQILDRFIDRTYSRKGEGGLFPLKRPKDDQRQVELWYQMQQYIDENFNN